MLDQIIYPNNLPKSPWIIIFNTMTYFKIVIELNKIKI